MRYCPNCGKELGPGVTRCWNSSCGFVLPGPNKIEDMTIPPQSIPQHKSDRLRELELEYALATRGLNKGYPATFIAMLSTITVFLTSAALNAIGKALLTGNQIVFIIGIVAGSIIIYFAFVFGRAAKIKAQITKEKQELQIEAGKKVR